MAKHTISRDRNKRTGVIKVVCACTFNFSTTDEDDARRRIGQHLKSVVDKIKPQKSLDI
jgi:hypothetical protein